MLDNGIKRWSSGSDLVESLKITLAKIFSDDDTDMDVHKIKISCEHLFGIALDLFYEGGEKYVGDDSLLRLPVTIGNDKYYLEVKQSDIKLHRDLNDIDRDKETTNITKEIIDQFNIQSRLYELAVHNDWIGSFKNYINVLLEQR